MEPGWLTDGGGGGGGGDVGRDADGSRPVSLRKRLIRSDGLSRIPDTSALGRIKDTQGGKRDIIRLSPCLPNRMCARLRALP